MTRSGVDDSAVGTREDDGTSTHVGPGLTADFMARELVDVFVD